MPIGVITLKCPIISAPKKSSNNNKRSNSSLEDRNSVEINASKRTKSEFEKYFEEVRNLGNSTLKGAKGVKQKDDILTKLGVPPPKQQKMPFKMRIGINEGRKKRAEKELNEAMESNLTLAKSKFQKVDKKREPKEKDLDSDLRGGVLYISKEAFRKSNKSKNR